MKLYRLAVVAGLLSTIVFNGAVARAQGTAFTYQGRLNDTGGPANGNYDATFTLYDGATNGSALVAGPVTNAAVTVSNGLFTTTVDLGGGFDGSPRWLSIGVRTNGGAEFVTLSPRQPLLPTPYAITAGNVTGVLLGDSLAGTYGGAVAFTNTGDQFTGAFTGDGSSLTNVNAATLDGLGAASFWHTTGNNGTSPQSGNFLGTLDDQPLEFWVNNARGFRIEPPAVVVVGTVVMKGIKSGPVPSSGQGNVPNLIGGGSFNSVYGGVEGSVIAGGGAVNSFAANTVGADFGFIGGGQGNFIQSQANNVVVGGGLNNTVQGGAYAVIGGGSGNVVQTDATGPNGTPASVIGGGNNNSIGTDDAFIGGGLNNAIQTGSTAAGIAGGQNNQIQSGAVGGFIGGGSNNVILNNATFGTIPGGSANEATNFAFAAGNRAKADQAGTFVWADAQPFDFTSTAVNQASFRSTGGARFVTDIDGAGNPTAGVSLAAGGTAWATISDQNAKKNFAAVDGGEVLSRLAAVPVEKWNYKWEQDSATPNIGPMAQAFKAAFYPGRDDKSITTLEFDGVELAAIQGLNQKLEAEVKAKDAKISELEKRLDDLAQMVQTMAAKK
ncbi:MAG: hypothetical protein P4N60_09420 [Verrucomicrobiae bacterium]|nr:hypothetical protein [Verrucomicrobiae bacterium]